MERVGELTDDRGLLLLEFSWGQTQDFLVLFLPILITLVNLFFNETFSIRVDPRWRNLDKADSVTALLEQVQQLKGACDVDSDSEVQLLVEFNIRGTINQNLNILLQLSHLLLIQAQVLSHLH